MRTFWILLMGLLTSLAASGAERAGYDSRGRIIALLSDGGEVEFYSNYEVVEPNGKRTLLLERQIGRGPREQGQLKAWAGAYGTPETGRFHVEWKTEDAGNGLHYSTTVAPESDDFATVEFVLDIPRDVFVNGRLTPARGPVVALTSARHTSAALFSGRSESLRFENAAGTIAIAIALDGARETTVIDRWDVLGTSHTIPHMPLHEGGQSGTMYYNNTRRSYQVRIPLLKAPGKAGVKASMAGAFSLVNSSVAPPARI